MRLAWPYNASIWIARLKSIYYLLSTKYQDIFSNPDSLGSGLAVSTTSRHVLEATNGQPTIPALRLEPEPESANVSPALQPGESTLACPILNATSSRTGLLQGR